MLQKFLFIGVQKFFFISWFPEKNIKGLVYPKMKILSLITHHDTNEDLFDEIWEVAVPPLTATHLKTNLKKKKFLPTPNFWTVVYIHQNVLNTK